MADDATSAWDPCATISTFLTLSDLSAAQNAPNPTFSKHDQCDYETPVLRLLADTRAKGYRRVCVPLTTEKWRRRWEEMCLVSEAVEGGDVFDVLHGEGKERRKEEKARAAEAWRLAPGFRRDEVTITRLDEAEGVVAMVSDWLELDSSDDGVRHDAEIALQQELAYATYLNINTAILPAPRNRDHVASYARIVSACLARSPYISLSVRLPIYNPEVFNHPGSPIAAFHPASPALSVSSQGLQTGAGGTPRTPSLVVSEVGESSGHGHGQGPGQGGSGASLNATWEMWDVIRSMCDYNPRLTLTLDLTPALPTTLGVLSKWAAESVRHIFLPSSTFIANTKGYPVLPKPTQQFIRDSMIHQPTIILGGVGDGHHSRGGEAAYTQYVRHLEKTSPAVQAVKKEGTVENFAKGYQDYLQAPLQPLMDNLPSITYQTFEQDPVKYALYEEVCWLYLYSIGILVLTSEKAMYRAFLDHPAGEKIVVCVAGAGRGPLVARCFNALNRARREATVMAVEKNSNAFVTLQERKQKEWGNSIHLIFGDMRVIDVPEKADILVSELLGSFGDNELSPECLDGAVRFLKPNGISIPSSYTAHLAPLSSSKLYNEARSTKNEKSLETPYVVMFQAVNILSGTKATIDGRCGPQVQECWEFEHPRREAVLDARGLPFTNSHNARSATMRFYIPHAGTLHGLAGYFEAVLYGNVGLSIHPHRKDQVSKDMLSWFPLFFPFKEPLYLPSNSELQVSIWRLTNERQVWYEWHAESFICVPALTTSPTEEQLLAQSGSFPSTPSFSSFAMSAPSPLADSRENLYLDTARLGVGDGNGGVTHEIVKIGHTSLHNPGGRSSWIGL